VRKFVHIAAGRIELAESRAIVLQTDFFAIRARLNSNYENP
jgi:hypothetical protein